MSIPWLTTKAKRDCMHHDSDNSQSLVKSTMINMGAGKMYWCCNCDQRWFV